MSILIISEKNKAAQAIAEALGTVKPIKKSKNLTIYEVIDKNILVIPLRGHILEYKNSKEYKSWKHSNPRDIIIKPDAIQKVPKKYAFPYIKALKELSSNSKMCIIGTDADVEGCNIGIYDALPFVKDVNPNIKAFQLWLNSLQKDEIQQKFKHLISPKYSWAASGEARAIIDAFIGFAATREVTNTFKTLLQKLKVPFTSIGRVQTCLLYLIYLREKEIEDFVPEKYFIIDAILRQNGNTFRAHHEKNPFKSKDENLARNIYLKIKDEKNAIIANFKKEIKSRSPPSPLNTSKALVMLTRHLKITPHVAMKIMNDLYLDKLISYPRTESDDYSEDFNHAMYISNFSNHSIYGDYSNELIKLKRYGPTKGRINAGDHPPITPLESVKINDKRLKSNLHKNVYDLLVRHYLALFGEPARELYQELKLKIKDEPFIAKLTALIYPGFFKIAPFLKPKYDIELNISNNTIPIDKILLEQKTTKPPPRYTDTTLLKLMEKNKIGTKSTRPIIIKILQARKLVKRMKRTYYITELGKFIIKNLISIWLPFLKPDFTRYVESLLEEIKEQKRSMKSVVQEVRERFLKLFDEFLAKKKDFMNEINNFKLKNNTMKTMKSHVQSLTTSTCPFCNEKPMKLVNLNNKKFLICLNEKCKKTLPLPKRGSPKLLKSKCSICNFNIVKIKLTKNKKQMTYYLCPKCWAEGFETNENKGFCSNCLNYKIENGRCIKKN
ncbi:MAG: DNA topoisomerase [Promethearchaeota archaeon]